MSAFGTFAPPRTGIQGYYNAGRGGGRGDISGIHTKLGSLIGRSFRRGGGGVTLSALYHEMELRTCQVGAHGVMCATRQEDS